MSGPLVAIIISTVIGAFVGWIALDIITARKDAKDMREQIEEFYKTPNPHFVPPPTKKQKPIRKRTVTFDKESGDLDIKWEDASKDEIVAYKKLLKGNGEVDEIYDDVMRTTPINAEAHLVDKSGFSVDWEFANQPLTTIEMHEPSCKCAYCGCTNDHIYGTCDYCGAPLEG